MLELIYIGYFDYVTHAYARATEILPSEADVVDAMAEADKVAAKLQVKEANS